MRDDYLWDGSGEPDPEIQKLESALGKLRHNREAPEFLAISTKAHPAQRKQFLTSFSWPRWAAATAFLLLFAAIGFLLLRPSPVAITRSDWDVTSTEGSPRVGGKALVSASGTTNLGLGQVLETSASSKASLRAENTGEIEVEPGTRLRIVASKSGPARLTLERGTIHATIWAPPGEFVVDTPSAIAVDLGCVYTLHVDDNGNGILRTTLGWVGFKLAGREAFIPAGAACATRKNTGPDTPYFEDAPEQFRNALTQLDRADIAQSERAEALKVVLTLARPRDALTLWHLLPRVAVAERGLVFERLAQLVSAPEGVTREGILRLEPKMLDLWWNELDLGDIGLWRHWERTWSQQR
jgi:hypothetical protein